MSSEGQGPRSPYELGSQTKANREDDPGRHEEISCKPVFPAGALRAVDSLIPSAACERKLELSSTRTDGLMDTGNYRKRILQKLARNLGLPKLTFQVIRRTIATLAQKKGTVKDVQGVLRHSRTATTTDVYMQEIPDSVRATVNAINAELRSKPNNRRVGRKLSGNLLPNATKPEGAVSVSC